MKNKINNKLTTTLILCILFAALFLPLVQSQNNQTTTLSPKDNTNWWNNQWPYRKLLTIDHTLVSGDLTNFPVLIYRITDSDLSAATQPQGQDIVFITYNDNTTKLPHEIEYYDHTTGRLITWVNITSLSSSIDTKLWMYYGNPTCGPQENIPATWDSNYIMVQHLNETGNTLKDSTLYQNNGISNGTTYTNTGKIDGAHLYNGNDRIVVNNFTHTSTALTVETWVYRDNTSFIYLACKGTYSELCDWILYLRNNQPANQGIDFSIQNHAYYIRTADTPEGSWFYLTATYENGNASLYFNATQLATATGWPSIDNNYPNLGLGNDYEGNEGALYPMTDTRLDEVRISKSARTEQWIQTCYTNQNNPTAFCSVAAEEQYEYTLTTTSDPSEGGTISVSPDPPYYFNDMVTLTAIPNPGYSFDQWSGDLNGNQNPDTLLMDANKTVTASFVFGNNPPIATNDTATVLINSTNNSIDVLANDYDPDGDNLTITAVSKPLHGLATQDGLFTYYTPNASYIGPDSFQYDISDGHGGTASATVSITVNPNPQNNPPLQPTNPIPDDGETNVNITTDLWWIGGDPDPEDTVTYDVYFGTNMTSPLVSSNQSTNTYDPGTLSFDTTYYWHIIAWDNHNASTEGDLWMFTTEDEEHEGNITVTITRPLENSFYFRNFRLLGLPRNTIIYGPITITASVTAINTSVDRVEFYVDGKLKKTDDSAPYSYRWSPLLCFKHDIMVIAYDTQDHTASDSITVFKWRFHPILLIGGWILLTST